MRAFVLKLQTNLNQQMFKFIILFDSGGFKQQQQKKTF